jgi:hypothetical protein
VKLVAERRSRGLTKIYARDLTQVVVMKNKTTAGELSKRSRSEQARVNGAKSHGPKTEAGKAISSLNARKHGFCARVALYAVESDPNWGEFLASYIRAFHPLNQPEMDAVEQLAESRWRRKRAVTVETTLVNLALGKTQEIIAKDYAVDGAFVDDCLQIAIAWKEQCGEHAFELSRRYIVSAERSYMRAFTELRALQGKRFQSAPEPEFAAAVSEEPPPPPPPDLEVDEERILRNEPKPSLPLETYFVPPSYPQAPVEPGSPTPDTGGNRPKSQ